VAPTRTVAVRYIALVSALRKLGFDMALPDALAAELRSAA